MAPEIVCDERVIKKNSPKILARVKRHIESLVNSEEFCLKGDKKKQLPYDDGGNKYLIVIKNANEDMVGIIEFKKTR
jgi:hypothetical protein